MITFSPSINKYRIPSHCLQTALGYILSQTKPRLGVATHFPNDPDVIGPALKDIRCFYQGPFTITKDLMVINVSKKKIRQRMAVAERYAWFTGEPLKGELAPPPSIRLPLIS